MLGGGRRMVFYKSINDPRRFTKVSKSNSDKVMVWGGIHGDFVTPLVFIDGKNCAERYVQFLNDHIFPLVQENRRDGSTVVFQQDGASFHRCGPVLQWLSSMPFPCCDWPPCSPDISPIEKIWARMDQIVKALQPRTKQELRDAIIFAWEKATILEARLKLMDAVRGICEKIEAVDGDNCFLNSNRCLFRVYF